MVAPRHSSHRTYLGALLVSAWQHGVDLARDAPGRAWRRWSLTLVAGYGLSFLTAAVCVQLGKRLLHAGLQGWDERVLAALAASPFSYPAGLWFEAWGSSAFLLPMLLVGMLLLIRGGYLFRALTLLVAYVATKGLVLGSWQLWARARPDVIADGLAAPGLHSFPSGHAVNAVAMFGLLATYWWRSSRSLPERALAVMTMSLAIFLTSLGRVRLGTHWPSDLVAGLVIGTVWLVTLSLAVVLAERASADGSGGGGVP